MTNNTFTSNTAVSGEAIYNNKEVNTLYNNYNKNTADKYGAVLYNKRNVILLNNTFKNNTITTNKNIKQAIYNSENATSIGPIINIITVKHITAGRNITINTTITNIYGNYINTGKITLKINKTTIGTYTITNGKKSIKYTIPKTYKGNYTITVTYTDSTNTLITNSSTTKIRIFDLNGTVGVGGNWTINKNVIVCSDKNKGASAMVKKVVSLLKAAGINAKNGGVGPSKEYTAIKGKTYTTVLWIVNGVDHAMCYEFYTETTSKGWKGTGNNIVVAFHTQSHGVCKLKNMNNPNLSNAHDAGYASASMIKKK